MRDLGLPSFDDPVGSVGLGEEVGGGRSQGPGGAAVCQKFQLGETLPVVPARIVRRVLRGDFVDMAELTEDNLELELRRGSEADEGKPVPLHKLKSVPDIVAWARSFCLYAGIVVSTHPSKTKDLWAYLAMLLAGAERGDWWRAYDSRFRQQLPALERADFGKLDQALFTRTMMSPSPSAPRGAQRGGPASGVEGRPAPVQKRRKVAACYAWNDGKPCGSSPCRFSHVRSKCGGDHKKSVCPPIGELYVCPPSGV